MKEFQALRTELNEGVEDLTEHVAVSRSLMPPNILILRRKTVRQFPDGVMVALYHNDKLGLQFSIPYGGETESVVTPVALKEELSDKQKKEIEAKDRKQYGANSWWAKKKKPLKEAEELEESRSTFLPGREHAFGANKDRAKWMADFEKHVIKAKPEHAGKLDWDTAHYFHNQGHKPEDAATLYNTRRRDRLEEGVIDRLRHIKDFHAVNHIQHADGTRTTVDPTTAHALLLVHDALKPEHKEKFAGHLEHSKPKFHKMLDFAWKNVK